MTTFRRTLMSVWRIMNRWLQLPVLALFGIIVLLPSFAHGQGMTIVPATCMPDESSLAAPAFNFETAGSVSFSGTTMTLRCNLPNIADYGYDPGWNYATVGFEDSSSGSLSGAVRVILRRVSLSSPFSYSTYYLLDSTTYGGTTGITTVSPYIRGAFVGYAYRDYQYILEISGIRTNPSETERVWYITFW